MIQDVVTRTTSAADWPSIRKAIHSRIYYSMGEFPASGRGPWKTVRKYQAHGLEHEDGTFEILPGWSCDGTIVYPQETGKNRCPAAVCIHETDSELYRFNCLSPDKKPDRAYGIELARRGYVCIAADQYGFGDWAKGSSEQGNYDKLAREFPSWSLDGIRLLIQRRAVDILSDHPFVDSKKIACIGHSLGGRTAVYLAAFDERVKATAASTGVSPNSTNVFRNCTTDPADSKSPRLNEGVLKTGIPAWEYEELLSLVAPRGLVLLEPFNDLYNLDFEAAVACVMKAASVYKLLSRPENCALICHGRGHDTPAEMRNYAYSLVDRSLGFENRKMGTA